MSTTCYILRHTDSVNDCHYYVAPGKFHESRTLGRIRLIAEVTPHALQARKFDTTPEAAQVLVDAGSPSDWEILPV